MIELSPFELGWLVGILEGEGYFGYEKWSYRVQVKMTDLDTIERVAKLFFKVTGRVPAIHESPNRNVNDSLPYVVSLHGNDAKLVMKTVVKHMSWRRRARIWQSLNKFRPKYKKLPNNVIELLKLRKHG